MAKRKTTKKITMEDVVNNNVEDIEKVEEKVEDKKEEVTENESEKEPEIVNTLSWKEVQEKYWILTDEIMDINSDLSKYKISKEDEKVLRDYVKKVYKSVADITLDKTHMPSNVSKIFEFYGLTLAHIQEWKLDKLTKEEKAIIEEYYERLFAENAKLVKRF